MQANQSHRLKIIKHLQENYEEHLTSINGKPFKRILIDVMACYYLIPADESRKKIGEYLRLADRTIQGYLGNIREILGTSKSEQIKSFIDSSNVIIPIEEHFELLKLREDFRKLLEEYLKQKGRAINPQSEVLFSYWQDDKDQDLYVDELEKDLTTAGIKLRRMTTEERKDAQKLIQALGNKVNLIGEDNSKNVSHIICILSEQRLFKLLEELKDDFKSFNLVQNSFTFIVLNANSEEAIEHELYNNIHTEYLICSHYYNLVLNVLTKVLLKHEADVTITKIIETFNHKIDDFHKAQETIHLQIDEQLNPNEKLPRQKPPDLFVRKRKGMYVLSFLILMSFFILTFFLSNKITEKAKDSLNKEQSQVSKIRSNLYIDDDSAKQQQTDSVSLMHSDLNIPAEAIILMRTRILNEIDKNLKHNKGIQTLALIGIGGAGKTTIARQYARSQKASLIWEIDAETMESLIFSFYKLSSKLANTKEDQETLRGIQDIKNHEEREEKLTSFVKAKLRLRSGWLLIYDNVEQFIKIKNLFPCDPNEWGIGKVIITTRDSNLQNIKHINYTLKIGELDCSEKLRLFSSIMSNGEASQFTPIQFEEVKNFLNEIPPFPLDVSLAAYYLKVTNISHSKYLEHMHEHNKSFENFQKDILKETNDYIKTRDSIITHTVKKIISIQDDFESLLILIGLLDSQCITRDLLDTYKNEIIVDRFIFNLKKYSLINPNSSPTQLVSNFSIHKTIQELILTYIRNSFDLHNNKKIIYSISDSLEVYARNIIDNEDDVKIHNLIKHLESFLLREDLLTDEIKVSIKSKLGEIYFYIGDYVKAKNALEDSLVLLENSFAKKESKLSQTLCTLGACYKEFGNYKKADEILRKCILILKSNTDNVMLCKALIYLGDIQRSMGHYDAAKTLYGESLKIHNKLYGETHYKTACIKASLANLYSHFGNYKKAIDLMESSYKIYENHAREKPIGFAWASTYLGDLYIKLGMYKESQFVLSKGLSVYRKYYGEYHIKTIWCSVYLAHAYENLGDASKALPILKKCLEFHQDYFKENHYRVGWASFRLGTVHKQLGHYNEAKNLINQSLQIYEKHYGKEHLEIAQILISLSEIYLQEERTEIAENSIKKALAILKKHKHPNIYLALETLSDLYLQRSSNMKESHYIQDFESFRKQAIDYLKQAQEIVKLHFPVNSPHIMRINAKLNSLEN